MIVRCLSACDAEVMPSMYILLPDLLLLPLSMYCDCFLWSAIVLDLTYFSTLARLFFAFACTCIEGKSFCEISSHMFSWPLPSGHSFIHESTLNNKLAAVPTLWSISLSQPPPKMLISTFSGWEEVVISMHACMYGCPSVRWWLANGMHANVFHSIMCESW